MILAVGKADSDRLERMEDAERQVRLLLEETRLLRAENTRLRDLVRAHRIPNVTAPGSPPGRIAPADYGVTSREALARMDQAMRVVRAAGQEAPTGPGISAHLAAHLDLDEG